MSWADRIARVSEREEFMTAQVKITFETATGVYDAETNTTTGRVVESLYEGKARVVAVRTSIFQQPGASMNSRISEFIRVQIPKNTVARVFTGAIVRIVSAPDSPFLENRILTVQSDFHGASSGSRTLECAYDNDSVFSA